MFHQRRVKIKSEGEGTEMGGRAITLNKGEGETMWPNRKRVRVLT